MGAEWVTGHLCPAIGVFLCLCMWIAPWPSMKNAIRSRKMGPTNPIPQLVMFSNSLGWVMYSVMVRDFYLFWSVAPGLVLGLLYSLFSIVLLFANSTGEIGAKEANRYISAENCIYSLVGIVFFWLLISLIVGIAVPTENFSTSVFFVGILCSINTISYHAVSFQSTIQQS